MRLALSAFSLLAVLALTGCGSGDDEPSTDGAATVGQTIEISETEFALDPSSVQVDETGTVTFRVTNDGAIAHALEVDGDDFEEETGTIEPGESAELTVDLSQEGSYELYCPIDDHRERGMEGELVVGSASAGGGTGTTDDDDDDDDDDDEGGTSTDDDGPGYG